MLNKRYDNHRYIRGLAGQIRFRPDIFLSTDKNNYRSCLISRETTLDYNIQIIEF